MKRFLAVSAACIVGALSFAGTAAADTFGWGPNNFFTSTYTYIRDTSMTYSPGGTARFRFNVDNAHSVHVVSVPCGANPANYVGFDIGAHDQTYHYDSGSYSNGACIRWYAMSLSGSQYSLSGYILS
jgi:hypothetical protein